MKWYWESGKIEYCLPVMMTILKSVIPLKLCYWNEEIIILDCEYKNGFYEGTSLSILCVFNFTLFRMDDLYIRHFNNIFHFANFSLYLYLLRIMRRIKTGEKYYFRKIVGEGCFTENCLSANIMDFYVFQPVLTV